MSTAFSGSKLIAEANPCQQEQLKPRDTDYLVIILTTYESFIHTKMNMLLEESMIVNEIVKQHDSAFRQGHHRKLLGMPPVCHLDEVLALQLNVFS